MMKQPRFGAFAKRRITIINLVPAVILREAYDISLSKEIIYPSKDDSIKSNQTPYCVDLIVPDSNKADLKFFFQHELNTHLPVKAELQKKIMPCYVLRPIKDKQILVKESAHSQNLFSFSSLAFEGEGIMFKSFVSYLENELNYPVYDDTGLRRYYDISFKKNAIEPLKSTEESLSKIGLELIKDQKEMKVLVITAR